MPLVEQEYIQNLQEQIYYLELEAAYMYEFDFILKSSIFSLMILNVNFLLGVSRIPKQEI